MQGRSGGAQKHSCMQPDETLPLTLLGLGGDAGLDDTLPVAAFLPFPPPPPAAAVAPIPLNLAGAVALMCARVQIRGRLACRPETDACDLDETGMAPRGLSMLRASLADQSSKHELWLVRLVR
jgi:hypothetical protein